MLLMEYMDLQSLDSLQKHIGGRVPEPILAKVADSVHHRHGAYHQVLCGMQFLAQHLRLLHCDIKPPNILLNTRGQVKLTDFGVSCYLDPTGVAQASSEGTTSFMSISSRPPTPTSFTAPRTPRWRALHRSQ